MGCRRGNNKDADRRSRIREEYGRIARRGGSCCGNSSCCGGASVDAAAKAAGYKAEELGVLPDGANMGLSCGNPTVLAALHPGEVILDLGSGGGLDVFTAARAVGRSGRAIGVDMTKAMVAKARRNARRFKEATGLDNVEFINGEIESLPLPDSSVDVVISNCVINLSGDKARVWREIARVLRPGGRVAVSDMALLRPLPAAVRDSVEAFVGCIAGAVTPAETREMMLAAGLVGVKLKPKAGYVAGMTEMAAPLYGEIAGCFPRRASISDYVTSLDITARKPGKRKRRVPA